MSQEQRLIYVGMHDGVCAVSSDDGGKTWRQGPVTALPHAAARLTASPVDPERAWLAAYEAGRIPHRRRGAILDTSELISH